MPWRSIPRVGIERIEIVPGGGSALYGNYALGGVIQALSRPIAERELEALAEVEDRAVAAAGRPIPFRDVVVGLDGQLHGER